MSPNPPPSKLRPLVSFGCLLVGAALLCLVNVIPLRNLAAVIGGLVICVTWFVAFGCWVYLGGQLGGNARETAYRVGAPGFWFLKAMSVAQGIWIGNIAREPLLVAPLYVVAEFTFGCLVQYGWPSKGEVIGPNWRTLVVSTAGIAIGLLLVAACRHLLALARW